MKKLIALLAVMSLAPSAMAAGDFSHDADFRVRYQSNSNNALDEDTGVTTNGGDQRFRWGTTFRNGEKFTGRLGITHRGSWGDTTKALNNQEPANSNADGYLVVNEANASWMATDELMIRTGRGNVQVADGTVVGQNDYENYQKAFDGILFKYDAEWASVGLFGVKGAELSGQGSGFSNDDPEGNFFGVSFDFKSLPDFFKMANLHIVKVATDDDTSGNDGTLDGEDALRYGITLAGDTAGVDYRLTYAMHAGSETVEDGDDIAGNMMDFEVGYSMPDMMNFRVHLLYHTDSGEDLSDADNDGKQYQPFHYNRHENAGLMDAFTWGNLTYMNLGFSLDATDSLNVALDYYTFSKTVEEGTVAHNTGATAIAGDETALGTEIDLVLKKQYDENFSIAFRYGMFTPGDALTDGTDALEDSWTQMTLYGHYSF